MEKLTGNIKITGHSSIEELFGDIMGYKKHPVQPLVDLPINDYFQTIASFESAMTVGAQYERFSHHDENKSRVDELWEAIESKLHGVNRNWRANTAAVYFVTSSMLELRISEVDELLDKIRDRLKVKEIVWGCILPSMSITTTSKLFVRLQKNCVALIKQGLVLKRTMISTDYKTNK